MAVNDSTATSICLYCKTTSEADSEKEFHEIYDETGLELQLPTLVEQFFHIKLHNKAGQCLCDDCVNRLIELYDLAEHSKQKEKGTSAVNTISEESLDRKELTSKEGNIISLNELKQGIKYSVQNKNDIDDQHINDFRKISRDTKKKEATTYHSTNNSTVGLVESNTPEDNSSNDDAKNSIIGDDIDYNTEIKQTSNPNTMAVIEISSEEFDIIEENPKGFNNDEQLVQNTTTLNDHLEEEQDDDDDEQPIIEDNSTKSSDNDVYTEDFVLEEQGEELDDEEGHIQERFHSVQDNEQASGSKPYDESNENVIEIDDSSNTSNKANNGETDIEKEHDGKADHYCTEEEYLVEETNFNEEYDCIDLNDYFDKAITTKFKDLELNWEVECKLCFEKYHKFQDLLNHSCLIELIEEQQCCCIIEGCEENQNDLNSFARHLILQHCDKLEDIAIYGRCPDCQKTFSNIIEFNKHSCCRNIKRKIGGQNYCPSCGMDFQSLKRYIFHMQFHLTNHRPKICLLCGSLFNNSNDFFEHIQYEHKPQGALACRKCDRFFKEKEVFESHMQLHEESKYQYACTYCPKKYTNKCGLNLHMDVYHNHKHKTLQCNYCDKEFFNNISYRNHMKTHVPDVQVESFVCSACGLITKYLDVIKDHVEQDKDAPCFSAIILKETLTLGYSCENCSLDFYSIKHLKQHRLSSIHSDKFFYCVICRHEFTTLRHMRSHATNHKEFEEWQEAFPITRYFVCNIGQCEEFYPLWSSLYYHKQRRHKLTKDTERNDDFKCQFCQQLCTSKMSLAIHVARSHNNSNIRCTECGQTYKSEKHLQDHIDKIHVEVACEICYKKFKNRRNLNIHNQSVHLNEKRYFCQYCNKGYFYKSEKDSHEKQVHSEVSYRCEFCNFVTNYPKSLEIHLDKHYDQLKFKCTICTKSFGRKQLLVQHINRHQGKKRYKCQDYFGQSDCDAAFITYNLLKNHIQKEHKNPSTEQKSAKRKRVSKSYLNVIQVEDDDNIEYIDDEDVVDSSFAKRSQESSSKSNNDARTDNDSFEIIVTNEISADADDNEYVIQYKDDVNAYSE